MMMKQETLLLGNQLAATGLYIAAGFAGGMATMQLYHEANAKDSVEERKMQEWKPNDTEIPVAEKELQKEWYHVLQIQPKAPKPPEGKVDDENLNLNIQYMSILNDYILELEIANKFQAYDTRIYDIHFCYRGYERLKKVYDVYESYLLDIQSSINPLIESQDEETKRLVARYKATLAYLDVLESKFKVLTMSIPKESRLKGLKKLMHSS